MFLEVITIIGTPHNPYIQNWSLTIRCNLVSYTKTRKPLFDYVFSFLRMTKSACYFISAIKILNSIITALVCKLFSKISLEFRGMRIRFKNYGMDILQRNSFLLYISNAQLCIFRTSIVSERGQFWRKFTSFLSWSIKLQSWYSGKLQDYILSLLHIGSH